MTSQPLHGEIISPKEWQAKARSDEQQTIDELGPTNAPIALAICDALGSDTEGLEHIAAREMGKEPNQGPAAARTFYKWRVRSAALGRIYARACQSRSHVIAHKLFDVVETETCPHKARVKMDAIKWLAAKFNRAEFGDDVQVSGSVEHNVNHGGEALAIIEQRLAKRAKRLGHDGGVGFGAENQGGDGYTPPHTLPSHTKPPSSD